MSRDEINIRIQMADEKIVALGGDIAAFCEDQRPHIKFEKKGLGGTGTMPRTDIPIRWRIMIGGIAYLLRSSLDHLVWQLVQENGNKPDYRNEFPIALPTEKVPNFSQMLKGVDHEHSRKIKAFNKDYTANLSPL